MDPATQALEFPAVVVATQRHFDSDWTHSEDAKQGESLPGAGIAMHAAVWVTKWESVEGTGVDRWMCLRSRRSPKAGSPGAVPRTRLDASCNWMPCDSPRRGCHPVFSLDMCG